MKRTLKLLSITICLMVVCALRVHASEIEKFSDEWYNQKYGKYGFSTSEEYYGKVDLVSKFANEVLPDVRVNGHIVEFPDAQPYIDENGRTLMPVRFVAEQMGANVSWDPYTQTAIIEKNGITVKVTIGQKNLQVIKGGLTETAPMDTVAVIKDTRTYVPIRFVAEALGAFVDYSTTCKTVGIYNDVLTREQIEFLHSLDYADQEDLYSPGYTYALENKKDSNEIMHYFGTDREFFEGNFANAREHVYRSTASWLNGGFYFKESGIHLQRISVDSDKCRTTAEYVDAAIEEVRATYTYDCKWFSSEALTDASCVYQGDGYNGDLLIRTIVKYTPKLCNPNRWFFSDEDLEQFNKLHLWDTSTMDPQYIVLDILVEPWSDHYTVDCWAALPQTSNLSREICKKLGFEGGCDLQWTEDSNYNGYVYELTSGSTSSKFILKNMFVTWKQFLEEEFFAKLSNWNVWTTDETGNGQWKAVDTLASSEILFNNNFDANSVDFPVIDEHLNPTQYRKVVAEDGTVSYQFGQWRWKYLSESKEWQDFRDTYDMVKRFNGRDSMTLDVWSNGEHKKVTYYAKDYPTIEELEAEYLNSWHFVPGAYVQNDSGQWIFKAF